MRIFDDGNPDGAVAFRGDEDAGRSEMLCAAAGLLMVVTPASASVQ